MLEEVLALGVWVETQQPPHDKPQTVDGKVKVVLRLNDALLLCLLQCRNLCSNDDGSVLLWKRARWRSSPAQPSVSHSVRVCAGPAPDLGQGTSHLGLRNPLPPLCPTLIPAVLGIVCKDWTQYEYKQNGTPRL